MREKSRERHEISRKKPTTFPPPFLRVSEQDLSPVTSAGAGKVEIFRRITDFAVVLGFVSEGEDEDTGEIRPGMGADGNQLPYNRNVTIMFTYTHGELLLLLLLLKLLLLL